MYFERDAASAAVPRAPFAYRFPWRVFVDFLRPANSLHPDAVPAHDARCGALEIKVPRDTNSSFEPQILKKRQRRVTGIDEMVLPLTAKGLSTGEVAAHFADVHGVSISKDTIPRITDKVIAEMTEWCNRPLEPACCGTPSASPPACSARPRRDQLAAKLHLPAPGCQHIYRRHEVSWQQLFQDEGSGLWPGRSLRASRICDGINASPKWYALSADRATNQTWMVHLSRNTFDTRRGMPAKGIRDA